MFKRTFIFLIVLISTVSCFSKDRYVDKNIGVSFIIPKGVTIEDKSFKPTDKKMYDLVDGKYTVGIGMEMIEGADFFSRSEIKITPDYLLKRLNKKEKGVFFSEWTQLHNFYENNGKIIGEYQFTLDPYELNKVYSIFLYFVKNNNYVWIRISYYDPNYKFAKKYPEYVTRNEEEQWWEWKTEDIPDKIYDLLLNNPKKAPEEFGKLLEYFKEIKDSLKILN